MLGVCRSKEIVSDTLTAFIDSYDYDAVLRETMDLTQFKVNTLSYIVNEPELHFCDNSSTVVERTDQMIG